MLCWRRCKVKHFSHGSWSCWSILIVEPAVLRLAKYNIQCYTAAIYGMQDQSPTVLIEGMRDVIAAGHPFSKSQVVSGT